MNRRGFIGLCAGVVGLNIVPLDAGERVLLPGVPDAIETLPIHVTLTAEQMREFAAVVEDAMIRRLRSTPPLYL